MLDPKVLTRLTKSNEPVLYDHREHYARLYNPTEGKVRILDVPRLTYFMIDGAGNPSTSPSYAAALHALYRVSFSLRFAYQRRYIEKDYVVPPLEALWWQCAADGRSVREIYARKDAWSWTLMTPVPAVVSADLLNNTIESLRTRGDAPGVEKVRIEAYEEGLCAQMLHVGTYSDEAADLERLHAHIQKKGYAPRGRHHEIYLNEARQAREGRLRVILRQPVA
jgi:hypothetical protein